ncbi:MAG: protein TolR [Aquificaceae bacterium]|nr:MAG: protein TolR [Aquificaceae bacterium]
MARKCKRRRSMAEMNVVPYIDVMLVLLVIFMVTAPMLQSGVEINLPDTNAKAINTNNQTPIIISVNEHGNYFNDEGSQIRITELRQYLVGQLNKRSSTDGVQSSTKMIRPVYIRGDENVAYRYLMQAMVAAQRAGAKSINLMSDPITDN